MSAKTFSAGLKIKSRLKTSPYIIDLKKIYESQQFACENKKPCQIGRKFFIFIRIVLRRIFKTLNKNILTWRQVNQPAPTAGRPKLNCRVKPKKQIIRKKSSLIKIIDRALYALGEAIVHIPFLFYLPVKMFFKGWLSLGDRLGALRRFRPASAGFWVKEIGVFLLISLFLILPTAGLLLYKNLVGRKGQVLGAAIEALNSAKLAANNLEQVDFVQAEENFKNVSQNLTAAENSVEQAGIFVQLLAKLTPQGRTLEDLIAAGHNLSQASILITQGLKEIQAEGQDRSITFSLKILRDKFQAASPYLTSANALIKNINQRQLPAEHQEQFAKWQALLPQVEQGAGQAIELFNSLLTLLGHNSWQRYLLLLQNNSEIRPSGGFLGAIAILDLDQGRVKNLIIPGGGAYDFRSGFKEKVLSPQPLSIVNPAWEMQDCNWFADFPSSAEKCQWFLEKSGGPSVDGVIAINSDFLADLLKILGPIEIESSLLLNNQTAPAQSFNTFDLLQEVNQAVLKPDTIIITAENFAALTQNIVESDSAKASGRPKAFLADLAPIILEKLFKLFDSQAETKSAQFWPSLLSLAQLMSDSLNKKNIQIYVKEPKLENWLKTISWAGEIKTAPADYLLVNIANVGGGKSDILIRQKITREAEIAADGSVITSITIRREHLGVKLTEAEQNILLPYERLINSRNIAYIRVYAPAGSELISATGGFYLPIDQAFKSAPAGFLPDEYLNQIERVVKRDDISGTIISQEFSKTVFANYMALEPGEFRSAAFKYKLPFKLKLDNSQPAVYSLLIQKQAGVKNQEFISRLKWPASYQIIEQTSSAPAGVLIVNDNVLEYKSQLEAGDEFYGLLLAP